MPSGKNGVTSLASSGVTTVLRGASFLDVFSALSGAQNDSVDDAALSSEWDGTKAVKRRGTLGRGTIFHISMPDHKGPGVPEEGAHVAIGLAYR